MSRSHCLPSVQIPNPIQAEVKRSKAVVEGSLNTGLQTGLLSALRGQATTEAMRFKETDRSSDGGDRKVATATLAESQQTENRADGPITLSGTVIKAAV